MSRRTKIVATLGPASSASAVVEALVVAGVDVVRLNLSHGTVEEHLAQLRAVRAAADRVGRTVAVLADLPGPKVRTREFPAGGTLLVEGQPVRLVPGGSTASAAEIGVGYATLLDDVQPGDDVMLGDGAITMRVESVDAGAVHAVVRTGGRVLGRPGVHLPSERLRISAPTDADLELLRVVTAAGLDYVAVSFVRAAADMERARAALGPARCGLVAKIETAAAVRDLEAIVAASDAVMVARGDLGIECALEDVPHLQKAVIAQAVAAGAPVITATQMLESMVHSPAPTRAEVSDVANAVLDGTDAVMLSAETAIGDDPVAVVATIARVTERAERDLDHRRWGEAAPAPGPGRSATAVTQAITHAAWQAARDVGVACIVCCTRSGATARAMARFRPEAPLLAVSPDEQTVRALALSWGVRPVLVAQYATTDEMVRVAVEAAVRTGCARRGDHVAVLAGAPDGGPGSSGLTDTLRIVRVG